MQENSGLYFTQQKLSLNRSNEALFCAVAFSLPISCAACDYLERGPFFILTLLLKLQLQKLCSYSLSKKCQFGATNLPFKFGLTSFITVPSRDGDT